MKYTTIVLDLDGTLLSSNRRAREANYEFLKAFYDDVLIHADGKPMIIEVAESGELAYDLGTTIAKLNGPDGPYEDHQKYLFVWKKIEGKWKTVAGHFCSDFA